MSLLYVLRIITIVRGRTQKSFRGRTILKIAEGVTTLLSLISTDRGSEVIYAPVLYYNFQYFVRHGLVLRESREILYCQPRSQGLSSQERVGLPAGTVIT